MNKLTNLMLLWGCVLISISLSAQISCEITIPTEVEVIRKSPLVEKLAKDKSYWICNESMVFFRAGNGTMFVESGSELNISHGNYTVYLRSQAKLNIGYQAKCTVYHERDAEIYVSGFQAQEFRSPCQAIVYDYSQAPTGLCPQVESVWKDIPLTPDMPNQPLFPTDITHTQDTIRIENEVVIMPIDTTNPHQALENSHIIPSSTMIIHKENPIYAMRGLNQTYWLCEGAYQKQSGLVCIYYVEKEAYLELIEGSNNIIYLKAGAKLSLGIGKDNKVFYEEGATVVTDKSRKTKFTKLMEMSLDYSQAPANGCK
jgi:hypothetical protein